MELSWQMKLRRSNLFSHDQISLILEYKTTYMTTTTKRRFRSARIRRTHLVEKSHPSRYRSTSVNMKLSSATLIAFAAGAIGAPADIVTPRQAPGGCSSAVKLDAKTNVWTSYTLHPNNFYRSEVEAAAAKMSGADAQKALKVADIGTFLWA